MIPEVRQKSVSNCIFSIQLTLPRFSDGKTEFGPPGEPHFLLVLCHV